MNLITVYDEYTAARIMILICVLARFYVNLTQARVIIEEG